MNNPPAFPSKTEIRKGVVVVQDNAGMTLRDYFAGQALLTMRMREFGSPEAMANNAYCIADAMLKERDNDSK